MPVSLRRLGCTRARARALAAGGVRSAAVAIDHPSSRICSGIHLGAYLGQVLAFDHLLDLGVRLRQRLRGAQLAERSEEHTSELQSRGHLVCRLLLEKKKKIPTDEVIA